MGGNPNRRQPVPARAEPTPAAIDAIEQTPPAPANAGDEGAEGKSDEDGGSDDHANAGAGATEEGGDDDHANAVAGATEARALLDFGDYQANDLVTGSEAEIQAMMLAGNVDPHPDAVAYAKSLQA